jgi:Transglutaminase-like superfamily
VRDRADLLGAAARAGLTVRQIEELPDGTITSRMVFEDPWAAARLLNELTEEDGADPIVREWSLDILAATSRELGEDLGGPTLSPELLDAYARALWDNVQTQIKFRHERKETFQSARLTMRLGAGDCDDHARLLVALAIAGGLEAELVFLEADDQPAHVVGLIKGSDGWYWAETTIDARFGEPPLEALDRLRASGEPLDRNPFEGISGPFGVVMPSDVQVRKDQVDAQIDSTDADVVNCAKLDSGTVSSWNLFVSAWRSFYADEPGFFTTGAQGRQVADYVDQLEEWQIKLKADGCTLTAAPIPTQKGDDTASTIKVVAIAAAVVAGAFALVEVSRLVPKAAR